MTGRTSARHSESHQRSNTSRRAGHLKKCFELVRAVCSVPDPDLLHLFDAVGFNLLIGKCDTHAKYFSQLRDGDSLRLAPLYDLVSTRAYPALSREMVMKIGGERNPMKLDAKNWPTFYEQAGIGQAPEQCCPQN